MTAWTEAGALVRRMRKTAAWARVIVRYYEGQVSQSRITDEPRAYVRGEAEGKVGLTRFKVRLDR
jgi:hypothetical protein